MKKSTSIPSRVWQILDSVKVRLCSCHRNSAVSIDTDKQPYNKRHSSGSDNGNTELNADENLRSISQWRSSSNKSTSSTQIYCGAPSEVPELPPATCRTAAPDCPPPPIPHTIINKDSQEVLIEKHHSQLLDKPSQTNITQLEDHPVIYPKPDSINQMAERKSKKQNSKSSESTSNDFSVISKRRSRSEDPHVRCRRLRKSMHESSNVKDQKEATNERYSMYTGHLPDEALNSGSESSDFDQRCSKNSHMLKKIRKSDRMSKTDKRRSIHNVENGQKDKMTTDKMNQNFSQQECSLDVLDDLRKTVIPTNYSNKAKFQRLEENRKKRIDITVTSDEECSPQLRISRLRQRAMLSLSNKSEMKDNISIIPVKIDQNSQSKKYKANCTNANINNRGSTHENKQNRQNENCNGSKKNGKIVQQKNAKYDKLPNVLPEFLPENRHHVKTGPSSISNQSNTNPTCCENQNFKRPPNLSVKVSREQIQPVNQDHHNFHQTCSPMPNESPKLCSFEDVKSNQPTQLRRAFEKIELTPRSLNSSSDSLDDLIESNIQYLESEIESGKLKCQSGNFTMSQQSEKSGLKALQEPAKQTKIVSPSLNNFHSYLQDPRSYALGPVDTSVKKCAPKVSTKPTLYRQNISKTYTSTVTKKTPNVAQVYEPVMIPMSGSATYSPNVQHKYVDFKEDLSKSDSYLNSLNSDISQTQNYYPQQTSYTQSSVSNKQTGNIVYVQPMNFTSVDYGLMAQNPALNSLDAGMFSDVDYNIEVSERIKKWEKKLTPGEIEENRTVLNTIKEYDSLSDSNQKNTVPEMSLEMHREIRKLMSAPDNSGDEILSVNLIKSVSSASDSNLHDPQSVIYFQPKVVSSETNLHRIFCVVQEPKTRLITVTRSNENVKVPTDDNSKAAVQNKQRQANEVTNHTQSLSNMTLSDSNMQQSWPPLSIDSDSGIRKSWRVSRYEDEINELKELVSDNFRDIRKKFDSDVSENDTRQTSSPVVSSQKGLQKHAESTNTVILNIRPVTPTNIQTPILIHKQFLNQSVQQMTSPTSPSVAPQTPKSVKNLPILYRSISNENKPSVPVSNTRPIQTTSLKTNTHGHNSKTGPDVWSPNMESSKGLVSIERVKARTLETIPFSEDPVWKDIEDLRPFERTEDITKEINFDEIDELLKLATGGVNSKNSRLVNFLDESTSNPRNYSIMSASYTQADSQPPFDQIKPRVMSDSSFILTQSSKHIFTPPTIQPLKLNSKPTQKSSTSALDEVLEDIRVSLQKKPLSPKCMKISDTTKSNSSTPTTLQSPLTKSAKTFHFHKEIANVKQQFDQNADRERMPTPGYDNTYATGQPNQTEAPMNVPSHFANVPYIDPEFTQFPYIINGNYHLDPNLLTEKLKSTGLAHDSSDGHTSNHSISNLPTTQQSNSINQSFHQQQSGKFNQSKPCIHELDQSVEDLRALAHEVELKLSQIKSRIVSADETKLDSIMVALRKFAPMTEQKYFNVKLTPNFESDKARRNKLENALHQLEKMYKSLDLDDKSLMERSSRQEEIAHYKLTHSEPHRTSGQRSTSDELNDQHSKDARMLKRYHIDEIERQTQNEFEDITKSFQVLLDEVTKQCHSVARASSKYSPDQQPITFSPTNVQQYSSQPPADEKHQEPPRHQFRLETSSQPIVQGSLSTAIKELQSVAMSNIDKGPSQSLTAVPEQPAKCAVPISLQNTKTTNQKMKQSPNNSTNVSPKKNLNIQLTSKTVASDKGNPNFTRAAAVTGQFVPFATEFKPLVSSSVRMENSAGSSLKKNKKNATILQVELGNVQGQSGSGVRLRNKIVNAERRKSMPTVMQSVETQTVETQTESSPSLPEMKEKFEVITRSVMLDSCNSSSPDLKKHQPLEHKISTGIARIVEMFSSSEDELRKGNKLKHSLSAPDIVSICDQTSSKTSKGSTPKFVKRRLENKARFQTLQMANSPLKSIDLVATVHSPESGVDTPVSKPPVYPVWQYPGQPELGSNIKRNDSKKQTYVLDRDLSKTASDTETDRFQVDETGHSKQYEQMTVIHRTRSVESEQDNIEQSKGFHELIATFEKNPQRLENLKQSGLRKCVSEDSMFTDFILQKIYHSDSDISRELEELANQKLGSRLKLALEMKVKS